MVWLEHLLFLSVVETLKVQGQAALLQNPEFRERLTQLVRNMDAVGARQQGEDSGTATEASSASEAADGRGGTLATPTGGGGLEWIMSALKNPRSVLPSAAVADAIDTPFLSWSRASGSRLERVEKLILSRVKRPHVGRFVPVSVSTRRPDPYTGEMLLSLDLQKIWTVTFPYDRGLLPPTTPLVMLHGFGVGSAFFCMNFDNLAVGRKVIAVDLPGFGRSSRPQFPTDPSKIENFFTGMLEQWRQSMGLNSFILLGHSFGGYIASCYASSFPERVEHLILADPWGLEAYPDGINWQKPIPSWIRSHYDWQWVHASGFLRACGPLGPLAVRGFSHYICKRFYRFLGGDSWAAADYVYQCNAVDSSCTEEAIVNLSRKILWARHPAMAKLATLPLDFYVSFIYGDESWLDPSPAENFLSCRIRGTVDVHTIPGVGHDSYAEDPPAFNQIVNAICSWVDTRKNVARTFSSTGGARIFTATSSAAAAQAANAVRSSHKKLQSSQQRVNEPLPGPSTRQ